MLSAVRPDTLITVPFTLATVGQLLKIYRLDRDRRLKTFLDLQLKLYSQVDADETALLYAATALGISQAPQGLFHLKGSMQVLSDRLVAALERDGGKLLMRHTVEQIVVEGGQVSGVIVRDQKTGTTCTTAADIVVGNVTVQNLVKLLGEQTPTGYRRRVQNLDTPSGAFVVYLGVDQAAIPTGYPPHLQFLYDYEGPIGENNSLFVSVSRPGDGRAPAGKATIIASSFTDLTQWHRTPNYEALKQQYTAQAIAQLGQFFDLRPENLVHVEAGTPRTFERFTGRDRGAVGGLGMRVSTFGPFCFSNRPPILNDKSALSNKRGVRSGNENQLIFGATVSCPDDQLVFGPNRSPPISCQFVAITRFQILLKKADAAS